MRNRNIACFACFGCKEKVPFTIMICNEADGCRTNYTILHKAIESYASLELIHRIVECGGKELIMMEDSFKRNTLHYLLSHNSQRCSIINSQKPTALLFQIVNKQYIKITIQIPSMPSSIKRIKI